MVDRSSKAAAGAKGGAAKVHTGKTVRAQSRPHPRSQPATASVSAHGKDERLLASLSNDTEGAVGSTSGGGAVSAGDKDKGKGKGKAPAKDAAVVAGKKSVLRPILASPYAVAW